MVNQSCIVVEPEIQGLSLHCPGLPDQFKANQQAWQSRKANGVWCDNRALKVKVTEFARSAEAQKRHLQIPTHRKEIRGAGLVSWKIKENDSYAQNRITEKYCFITDGSVPSLKGDSHSIELVEIHLPSLPELPPHYHTTNGLPTHLNSTLLTALDMAIPNASNIFKTLSPDLVIYDINQAWVPTIASPFNIPIVQFMTTGTTVVSYSIHFIKNHGGVEFPFPEIKLREFHEKRYHNTLLSAVNHPQNKQDAPVTGKPSCNILLFNTFRELEGKYIDYLSVINEKKVVPVGPLVQDIVDEIEQSEIMQWLFLKW
ncbi:beta-D-glucosyl crocetin beta-1,6-glucosyltransferase-like [Camellia sinensis]|uniref:beta-D-glucosyl crocetin beta-1,6-glucosyltransferase-like n=1 Tax=Camellia sinensis TaxID=4442 RepID=UPI001035E33F|nr:beta-D-glucosyl crocetin beta-1,6-glucosyltransferase-like [Camellia sinensis]